MVNKAQLGVRVNADLFTRFKDKCRKEGRMYGPVVEILMGQWVNGKVKI